MAVQGLKCFYNNHHLIYLYKVDHRRNRRLTPRVIASKFSVTWSCVSLPRYTTSSDRKCMGFVIPKTQHMSVFNPFSAGIDFRR